VRRIVKVEVVGPLALRLKLTDGSYIERSFVKLSKSGVFKKLGDPRFFRRVRLKKEFGTIVWPGDLDLCPDVLIEGRFMV
jgi:hypothetical protein